MKRHAILAFLPLLFLGAVPLKTYADALPGVPPGAVKLPADNEFADRYRNPDGTFTAVIHARPIRQRTAQGWQDLTGVLGASDTQGYQFQGSGKLTARIGGSSAGAWNTVSRTGRSVSFALASVSPSSGTAVTPSASAGAVQADGRTVLFASALPNTDLRLVSTPMGGIKEALVLQSASAVPWNGEFTYALRLTGLDANEVTDSVGSHVLLSEHGTGVSSPVMQLSPPFATDAKGARTDSCWYLLSDDRTTLTLVVDPNWLQDPSRSFPITIDPSVDYQPDAVHADDTYSNGASGSTGTNYGTDGFLYFGKYSTTLQGAQTYLRMPVDAIPKAATINSATLQDAITDSNDYTATVPIDVYTVGSPWDERTLTQSSAPSSGSYLRTVTFDPNGTNWTFDADVTTAVSAIFAGTTRNYGFNLRLGSGAAANAGVKMYSMNDPSGYGPLMIVNYTAGSIGTTYSSGQTGAPRPWQAGTALNPHQTLNLANGNVLTTLPITGWQGFGPAVALSLVHNSRQDPTVSTPISPKWWTNYGTRLSYSGSSDPMSTVYRWGPDGTLDTFTYLGGVYTPEAGVYDTLVYSSTEGDYQLTTHDQNVWRYSTSAGKLLSITDPNGQAVTLTYDGSSRLTTITDANPTSGNRRSLTLAYDTSSRISTITDPLSRVWTLVYDASTGDLDTIKLPRQTDGTSDSLEYAYQLGYDSYSDGSTTAHDVISIGEPNENSTLNSSPVCQYKVRQDPAVIWS